MRAIKLVLLFVMAVALTAIVLQNQAPWHVRFLWMIGDVPIILLSLTAVTGGIAGIAATAFGEVWCKIIT